MGRSVTGLLLAGVLLLSFTPSLGAYSKTLTPKDIRAAIEYGKTRQGQDLTEDGHPHSVTLWNPKTAARAQSLAKELGLTIPQALQRMRDQGETPSSGFATVYTPWLEIASVARTAAAQYREPSPAEISAAAQRATGRVRIIAFVIDDMERFWQDPHSVIRQSGTVVQPVEKSGHFSRVVSCQSSLPCLTSAVLTFTFLDSQVKETQEAELVIILRGGYKELRASLNLAAMR